MEEIHDEILLLPGISEQQIIIHEKNIEELLDYANVDKNEAKIILQQQISSIDVPVQNLGFWSSIWQHGWKPTNSDLLMTAEARILQTALKTKYEQFFVDLGGNFINTIKLGNGPPLVMLHGYGGGVAIWIDNVDALAQHYTVYAIDILGFGRSSRPIYTGKSAEDAEKWFLESLELWCDALKLKEFYLLGHSFGAFLSAIFTLQYPQRVLRLILADPWGVPERPENVTQPTNWRFRAITTAMSVIPSPFSLLRALGPVGPSMIERVRPDLTRKFAHIFNDTGIMSSYIYHCNAQNPSGEIAFAQMQSSFGWAKLPLEKRLKNLHPDIPVSTIYGERTWMDYNKAIEVMPSVPGKMDLVLIPQAGHHVYIDSAKIFNEVVIAALKGQLKPTADSNHLQYYSNYYYT